MNKYISNEEKDSLKRDIQKMPSDVEKALKKEGLVDKYKARPAYQKNDYLAWIKRAKQDKTRESRINQMLSELKSGNKYMKMDYSG